MKIIVVMPVKNEEWILENSLKAASLFADHIIVADQNSTDKTPEICKRFDKVIVIQNPNKFHTSNVRLQLLNAAREFTGHNAIFSFDADEIPTSHILTNDFKEKLMNLPKGSSISFQWINLWRSLLKYRDDNSVWANSWKHFGFIDDRKSNYTTLNVISDHTSRVPLATLEKNNKFDFPKVLHFQFVDWERMLAKQRYYRVAELVQRGKGFLTSIKINFKYYPTKDEGKIFLKDLPGEWIKVWLEKSIKVNEIKKDYFYWQEAESKKFFKQYGTEYFKWLDIWDKDWGKEIKDPRPFYIKFYHKHLQPLLGYNGFFYKIYRFLNKYA